MSGFFYLFIYYCFVLTLVSSFVRGRGRGKLFIYIYISEMMSENKIKKEYYHIKAN